MLWKNAERILEAKGLRGMNGFGVGERWRTGVDKLHHKLRIYETPLICNLIKNTRLKRGSMDKGAQHWCTKPLPSFASDSEVTVCLEFLTFGHERMLCARDGFPTSELQVSEAPETIQAIAALHTHND